MARSGAPSPAERHRIAMVCDFFYPSSGGVESHVHVLAQCLLRLGHKVIVITHQYGSRRGVRWLDGGLKVYHMPFASVYDRCIMPGCMTLLLRDILCREAISIVHTHAVCTMSFEAAVLAALWGYRVVHTEHSNYGFTLGSDILVNQLESFVLLHADTVIAVSHTAKENATLRCGLRPSEVHVIPNAVNAAAFRHGAGNVRPTGTVNVVVMTRLVWRKGVHLLVDIVPEVCRRCPHVHFIIGGDGPKRAALEQMVEQHDLQRRVELLGGVQHSEVPSVLARGHVFLNTSLTEAFCISILEAVCCGLAVVTTRVGGVPEILPSHMVTLTEPEAPALIETLARVVDLAREGPLPNYHEQVARMYSWPRVARRTARVYDALSRRERPTLRERLRRLRTLGPVVGPVCVLLVAAQHLVLRLLQWWRPAEDIELAPDFPRRPARVRR